jgi:phage head maturation protease
VNQSSFAFVVGADGERWDDSEVKLGKLPLRRITQIAELYDVSAVTYPAYDVTTVSARAQTHAQEHDPVRIAEEHAQCQARAQKRWHEQAFVEAE